MAVKVFSVTFWPLGGALEQLHFFQDHFKSLDRCINFGFNWLIGSDREQKNPDSGMLQEVISGFS